MVLVMVFPDSVSQIRGVRRESLISGSSPCLEAEDGGARWVSLNGQPASSSAIVVEQCSDSMNRSQALSTAGEADLRLGGCGQQDNS